MHTKRKQKLDGWLLVDKPLNVTSAYVVNRVKYAFNACKVGHSGTLDPLATGLLPIAFGQATKTIPYIMDKTKVYHFELTFGESRTTDDAEGEVLDHSEFRPGDEQINKALQSFQGEIYQVPPIYSAVKVQGRRSYDLARQGEKPQLKERLARIDSFRMIERIDKDRAKFEVVSGKGVYMRSLARDLAVACNTVGYVSELRRLRVGPFDIANAFLLDKLVENGNKGIVSLDMLLPVQTALDDIPALAMTEEEAESLNFGKSIDLTEIRNRFALDVNSYDGIVRAMKKEHFIGLCHLNNKWLRPVRIFNI